MTKGYRKALNAPKLRRIHRKGIPWTVKSSPGPHSAEKSVPLKVALRDHMKITENGKEAERIIKEGKIKVDGKTVRDHKHPVGFMDVVTVDPSKSNYRANYDQHGKMRFTKINDKEAKHKLSRVERKNKVKGGKTQITLHDGKNIIEEDADTGDSVKITLPDQEVEKIVKLKEGNKGYIISGRHAGEILEITGIMQGTRKRPTLIELGDIKTQKKNVFPIGEKNPEVEIGEEND